MRDLAGGCRPSETMHGTRLTIGLSSESLSSWSTRERIEAANFSVRLAVHAKERLVRAENKRNRGNREGKDWSKWTFTLLLIPILTYAF